MTDLIRMAKDGEAIDVHPTAVKQHLLLGWKLAPLEGEPETSEEEVLAAAENFTKRGPGRPKKLPNVG